MHTNQSGVGRGYFDLESVYACNARMYELLGCDESYFEAVCIAPEVETSQRTTESRMRDLNVKCVNINEPLSYFVGDRMSDWQTALNADMKIAALLTGKVISEQDKFGFKKMMQ